MPKKRQYIDKKHCQRFSLVPNASFKQDELLQTPNGTQDRRKEQNKFGIFYDDDYNYLKHLKSSSDYPGELLQVFRIEKTPDTEKITPISRVNEDKSFDPEIDVTFQDEFDSNNPENTLEDDFVQIANGDADMQDTNSDTFSSNESDGCSNSDENLQDAYDNNANLLNERFEKLYESYKDEDIGPLDDIEFEENASKDEIILENLLKSSAFSYQKEPENDTNPDFKSDYQYESSSNSESNESHDSLDDSRPKEMWDCESILSKPRCNANQSRLIKDPFKIAVSKKGIPLDDSLTSKRLTDFDRTIRKGEDETNSVTKRDTASYPILEDKLQNKIRKQAIKQEKRERRVEKKQNKNVFRHEHIKAQTLHIHNLHNHPGAIKIP